VHKSLVTTYMVLFVLERACMTHYDLIAWKEAKTIFNFVFYGRKNVINS